MYRIATCSLLVWSLLLFGPHPAHAFVTFDDFGRWPKDWPEKLEPYREHSLTANFSVAANEVMFYQIPFFDREEFEKLWPALLSLKSKGAPITLVRVSPDTGLFGKTGDEDWSNARPCVRVIGPPGSASRWREVEILRHEPPKRPELWSENGELPKYVHLEEIDGTERWVAGKGESLYQSCWIELQILVDGEIIDADRLDIPEDVTVIDRRKPAFKP